MAYYSTVWYQVLCYRVHDVNYDYWPILPTATVSLLYNNEYLGSQDHCVLGHKFLPLLISYDIL